MRIFLHLLELVDGLRASLSGDGASNVSHGKTSRGVSVRGRGGGGEAGGLASSPVVKRKENRKFRGGNQMLWC